MQPMAPQRSGIPRVVGILAIIFACLGVGMAALFTWGPLSDIDRWDLRDQLSGEVNWIYASAVLSGVVFVLHMLGGIAAVRYAGNAPKLMTFYAVFALALAIGDMILTIVLFPKNLDIDIYQSISSIKDSVVTPRVGFEFMALIWPIVALALMNTRRAKEACGGAASAKPQDVF
jgi:hypothetical protein